MRKVFGILFIVFGVVCLPSVFANGLNAAQINGRIIAWILISVVPAYFLLRNKKKKDLKIDDVGHKKPFAKKFFKILFSGLGILFVCSMIFAQIAKVAIAPLMEKSKQKAELERIVERADRVCPIPAAMGKGAVTSVKLEDGNITFYLTYDSDNCNVFSKLEDDQKIREGILMSILCLNAQDGNLGDRVMDLLAKYDCGIRIVITESAIGRFDFKVSSDEIQTLREKYQINPHEALFNLLSLNVEAERASLPMNIAEGVLLKDYRLEDENLVFDILFDENIYSIEAMSANKDLLKENFLEEGLSDSSGKSLLDLCKASHSGIKYVLTGNQSNKSFDILLSSEDIQELVETPSQANIH